MSLEAKELEKHSNVVIKKGILCDITKIWTLVARKDNYIIFHKAH